ncbi:hypothetical protein ACLSZP_06530 [Avibacterium avium]|uniref:hypothetical protein n=1 Tax=Avibacterium avium TaxID=751 RepID=UPI003BF8E68B
MNFYPTTPRVQYCEKCGWVCTHYVFRTDVIPFKVECKKCKTDEFIGFKAVSECSFLERLAIKIAGKGFYIVEN